MIYKEIDLSKIHLWGCSEEAAKGIIDWRISSKKGISQRVFNHALKVAVECLEYDYDSVGDVFLRWEESNWTGIKYVKQEAMRLHAQKPVAGNRLTRDIPLEEKLTDISWAYDINEIEQKELN